MESSSNEPNKESFVNGIKRGGNKSWWQPAIIMFLKLSVWIAAPIIIALYLGKWLDEKFSSGPWLFLICIGLAFVISIFGLIKNTFAEFKKIEKENKIKANKK